MGLVCCPQPLPQRQVAAQSVPAETQGSGPITYKLDPKYNSVKVRNNNLKVLSGLQHPVALKSYLQVHCIVIGYDA